MKRYWPAVVAGLIVAGIAAADTVKTWSNGETLRATDLNTVIAHLHTYMVGGAGQGHAHNLLVDGDVSTTAAIQHSKMQRPGLLPKAWARVGVPGSACAGAAAADTACSVGASQRVTRVSSAGSTGVYRVYLSYLPANAAYIAIPSPQEGGCSCALAIGGVLVGDLYTSSASTEQFDVVCTSLAGAAQNCAFGFLVMDDDN